MYYTLLWFYILYHSSTCISWLNFWGTQSRGHFQGAVNIPDVVQCLDRDIVDIVELMNLCVQQRWGTEVGQGCYEHNDGGGSARKVHVQAMRYICVLFSLLGAECMGSSSSSLWPIECMRYETKCHHRLIFSSSLPPSILLPSSLSSLPPSLPPSLSGPLSLL